MKSGCKNFTTYNDIFSQISQVPSSDIQWLHMNTKNIVIAILALLLIGAVSFLFLRTTTDTVVVIEPTSNDGAIPVEPNEGIGDGAEPLEEMTIDSRGPESIIGTSVGGTEITAYHFGAGDTEVLLVGGVHGGYSPNTTDLANEFVAYFNENPSAIPNNVTVTIIPNLNPDGATKSGAAGRFNAHTVDLNRNFDCDWSATSMWRDQEVSGGTKAFSEPESAALRDYVDTYSPNAAIVWFSSEGKVYPSACEGTPSNASVTLAATFATAAGYPAEAEFDAYTINGDMVNWMAKEGIPAISVLLSDHQSTEWSKNKAGVEAILTQYAE